MALELFPCAPRRSTAIRMAPSSYRTICRMVALLIVLQLITIAVLVVEVVG